MRNLIVVATFVLGSLLTGCASVPMASLESDTARKKFPSPSPGTAGLYIYRNTNLGGALKKFIYIDGELVAETGPMTYFYFEVQGGKRKLSTESEFSENDLIVDIKHGKNYFVRQSIKFGVFAGGANLELVPEEEGKNGVLECKLGNNLDGNVMVKTEEIKTPETTSQSISRNGASAFEYYGQAEDEINTQTYDKNLWAKALVEAEGDQTKRKARYIELRADQLYIEQGGSLSATNLYKQSIPDTGESNIDISGTYVSDRIRSSWTLKHKTKLRITLKQESDSIKGRFINSLDGPIRGAIDKNKIEFTWEAGNCSNGDASMTVIPDGSALEGVLVCGSNSYEVVFRPI